MERVARGANRDLARAAKEASPEVANLANPGVARAAKEAVQIVILITMMMMDTITALMMIIPPLRNTMMDIPRMMITSTMDIMDRSIRAEPASPARAATENPAREAPESPERAVPPSPARAAMESPVRAAPPNLARADPPNPVRADPPPSRVNHHLRMASRVNRPPPTPRTMVMDTIIMEEDTMMNMIMDIIPRMFVDVVLLLPMPVNKRVVLLLPRARDLICGYK